MTNEEKKAIEAKKANEARIAAEKKAAEEKAAKDAIDAANKEKESAIPAMPVMPDTSKMTLKESRAALKIFMDAVRTAKRITLAKKEEEEPSTRGSNENSRSWKIKELYLLDRTLKPETKNKKIDASKMIAALLAVNHEFKAKQGEEDVFAKTIVTTISDVDRVEAVLKSLGMLATAEQYAVNKAAIEKAAAEKAAKAAKA